MPSFRPLSLSLRSPQRNRPTDEDGTQVRVPIEDTMVDSGIYIDGMRLPGTYSPSSALAKVNEAEQTGQTAFTWIGLHEPGHDQMQELADVFGLHPLTVEDAVHAHQRPKLERYDEILFLVLKTVNYVPHESVAHAHKIIETGEIMVFVGPNFVLTVRHGEYCGLGEVRSRMDTECDRMRLGPPTVMHAVADHVVGQYRKVTELMETDIDTIEEVTFTPGHVIDVEQIYQVKREVVELRRSVTPLSAPFQRLQSEYADLVTKEIRRGLRDVGDRQAQAADQIAGYDETLSSLASAAAIQADLQLNTDMRKISAWAAILTVPTLITGYYGMNFPHMPIQQRAWGFPVTLAIMAGVCLVLYRAFRRNHWL